MTPLTPEPLLRPRDVADLFGRHPKTIARWEGLGRFGAVLRTAGGHRRFRRSAVQALLDGEVDPVLARVEALADGRDGGSA